MKPSWLPRLKRGTPIRLNDGRVVAFQQCFHHNKTFMYTIKRHGLIHRGDAKGWIAKYDPKLPKAVADRLRAEDKQREQK